MNNKSNINNPSQLASIGNFTKHAVKSFENKIVTEHNFLEKVDSTLNNKNNPK